MPEDIHLLRAGDNFTDTRRLTARVDVLWQAQQQGGATINLVPAVPRQAIRAVPASTEGAAVTSVTKGAGKDKWMTRIGHFGKGKHEWLVVGESCEIPVLAEVAEMLDGPVGSEELSTKSAVFLLGGSWVMRGCQLPLISCSCTLPTAVPDVLTVRAVGALIRGCTSIVAFAGPSMATSSQTSSFSLSARALNSDCMILAVAGMKRW